MFFFFYTDQNFDWFVHSIYRCRWSEHKLCQYIYERIWEECPAKMMLHRGIEVYTHGACFCIGKTFEWDFLFNGWVEAHLETCGFLSKLLWKRYSEIVVPWIWKDWIGIWKVSSGKRPITRIITSIFFFEIANKLLQILMSLRNR